MKRYDKLVQELNRLNNEETVIPSDMALAIQANRPEMLGMIERDMTPNEVSAVMNLLKGYMQMNDIRKEIIEILLENRDRIRESVIKIGDAVSNAREDTLALTDGED